MNERDINLANERARLRDLKAEARRLEERIAERERPRTYEDEHQLLSIRAAADQVYRDAGRLGAPEPMTQESPRACRMRILDDLRRYHKDWSRPSTLDNIRDDTALNAVEQQVFEAARKNGPSYGLKPTETRERVSATSAGAKVIEYVGGPDAWFGNAFRREPPRALLKTQQQYKDITKNNLLSRITQVVPGYMRQWVGLAS
jgi:hypothetical protein